MARKFESAAEFLAVFVPAVKDGKSLKEIAALFGDGRKPSDVSVKASQLRKKYNDVAELRILEWEKVNGKPMPVEDREKVFAKVEEKVPLLKKGPRGGATAELTKELDDFMGVLSQLQAVNAENSESTDVDSEAQA